MSNESVYLMQLFLQPACAAASTHLAIGGFPAPCSSLHYTAITESATQRHSEHAHLHQRSQERTSNEIVGHAWAAAMGAQGPTHHPLRQHLAPLEKRAGNLHVIRLRSTMLTAMSCCAAAGGPAMQLCTACPSWHEAGHCHWPSRLRGCAAAGWLPRAAGRAARLL